MGTPVLVRKDEHADPRAALKRAVADAQKAKGAVIEHQAAIERAEQQIRDAEQRLVAATAVIEKERKHLADQMADAATAGRQATATGAMRAARLAAADAEDTLAAAKDALSTLQADFADMETDAAVAGRAVNTALAETLKPLASRLLEEVRGHHLRFLTTQAALRTLGRLWDPWDDLVKQIDRTASFTDADQRVSITVEREWQAALEALKTDPDDLDERLRRLVAR